MRSKSPTPSLPEPTVTDRREVMGEGEKASPPTPLQPHPPTPSPKGEGSEMRDTPIVWGNLLVIPKRIVPSTPPLLSERGLGGEAFLFFLYPCQKP